MFTNLFCLAIIVFGGSYIYNSSKSSNSDYEIGNSNCNNYNNAEHKVTKLDFTSKESWQKEVDSWNDYEVKNKIHSIGADHYGFCDNEARRYLVNYESNNKRDSRYGKCIF